jgi:exopolyphosphatase/guanosine-5'-triphosphate,3'-diphosphate pyrophosphatase
MLLGAIDVGTNSIHLVVVEMDPRFGTSRTVLKAREMVRLGGGAALLRGHLSKKAIQRGIGAIAKFAEAARAAGAADIRAVATSAVREASNREEFLAAVRATSGVNVEVLSENEEARLIHLGVTRGFPLGERVACIFDVGGGSTEFIIGDAHRPFFLQSVKLGSLRLYDQFLTDQQAAGLGYKAMERHIREVLAPAAARLRDYRFDVLLGTSGTVMGLAAVDVAAAGVAAQRTHGYVLRLERLRELQRAMVKMTPEERRKIPGMNPRRADIIVAGNALIIALMEALERDELIVCERALREGIVVDYLERNLAVARRLGDEQMRRFDAVHELADRFGGSSVHENQVAALALQLFDGLHEVHGFEPAERDVLFAAAVLHDVGRAITESGHHKHGAYVVRNAGLPGWRPDEVSLIADLVRYHRKSLPKATHAEWIAASAETRNRILGLGALLRLADGLDRRHLGVVGSIAPRIESGVVRLRIEAQQDVAPEIEAALFKSDLFERAFNLKIAVEPQPAAGYEPSFDNEPSASEILPASLSG